MTGSAGSEGSQISLEFFSPVSHPDSFWSLASSTSFRCLLSVVASTAGNSICVCRHHVLLKSKERVVLFIRLDEISSVKVMCLFMGPITGQGVGYCDWSGQYHVSIQPTRSWGFVSGSSLESVDQNRRSTAQREKVGKGMFKSKAKQKQNPTDVKQTLHSRLA